MLKKALWGFLFIIFLGQIAFAAGSSNVLSASELYKKKVPSVLFIATQDSSGSGAILKDDGTFVTCFHVIANADYIFAKSEDGAIYYVNGYRYLDPKNDVAILTLDTKRKFIPFSLNPSNNIKIGEKIYAISNPQTLQFVLSDGIINQFTNNYIQFSAPVSQGSSGGALFNTQGKLLGIITSLLDPSEAQNINFALPNSFYAEKMNAPVVINTQKVDWTEFMISQLDIDKFEEFTQFATDQRNSEMFYKYMNAYIKKKGMPDHFYNILGFLAMLAYMDSGEQTFLDDAIKWYNLSYKDNTAKEESIIALIYLKSLKNEYGDLADLFSQLEKKYKKSYIKLNQILNETNKCQSDDDECFTYVGAKYMNFLMKIHYSTSKSQKE